MSCSHRRGFRVNGVSSKLGPKRSTLSKLPCRFPGSRQVSATDALLIVAIGISNHSWRGMLRRSASGVNAGVV
eukprot:8358410-Alexandrium_andersonii.AAC.1